MSWNLSNKEYKSVIVLSGMKRYSYFVKKVADWEEVWSLRNQDGWVLAVDSSGVQVIPVWPHKRYAEACLSQEWENCEPVVINLEAWMQKWIPGMIQDARQIAVFPTPEDRGVVVKPIHLQKDLSDECEQYE